MDLLNGCEKKDKYAISIDFTNIKKERSFPSGFFHGSDSAACAITLYIKKMMLKLIQPEY